MNVARYQASNALESAKSGASNRFGGKNGIKKQSEFGKMMDQLSISQKGRNQQEELSGIRNLTKAEAQYLKDKYAKKYQNAVYAMETEDWDLSKPDVYSVEQELLNELRDLGVLTKEEVQALSNRNSRYVPEGLRVYHLKEADRWENYDSYNPASNFLYIHHLCTSGKFDDMMQDQKDYAELYLKVGKILDGVFTN